MHSVWAGAAGGTLFAWMMTVGGAATVFLFRRTIPERTQRALLGFAAGVMIAASAWGLLIPAMERAQAMNIPGYLPAAGGFLLGAAFLAVIDGLTPRLCVSAANDRASLLFLAVTLHNIPEGMAVGLSFVLAAQSDNPAALAGAAALAFGIGVQNFPEGAAVALPLRREGMSAARSFVYGALSGIVEPIFGLAVVLVGAWIAPFMPWLLSFAAGAMLYVTAAELIPEAQRGTRSIVGTAGVMLGFAIMMALDCALG